MSNTFKPKHVPSDVVARWPVMALSLWKRSFKHQASILLAAALVIKFLPAWSTVVAFLIAPSLFIVSFVAVQIADEKAAFSWSDLVDSVLPGILRLGHISLQFMAVFGLGIAVLAGLSSMLLPESSATAQHAAFDEFISVPPSAGMASEQPQNSMLEFIHFCATCTEGVMAMVFLGMFVVAIYQGVFGVVLHAQEGMGARESRMVGWQAWQVNTGSIETALRDAPTRFWCYLAAIVFAVMCAFQTVYLSPIGLVLATYIPCLSYVAYRSIFFGMHENVPASARVKVERTGILVPAFA